MTHRDPIGAEVRKHREAFAREHGNSVDAIVTALRRDEASGKVATVSLPPKKIGKRSNRRLEPSPR